MNDNPERVRHMDMPNNLFAQNSSGIAPSANEFAPTVLNLLVLPRDRLFFQYGHNNFPGFGIMLSLADHLYETTNLVSLCQLIL